jgi:20S proteasome alpha/beta subunit
MTLVAGFRGRQNGILICADREENDGYSKREVEKIYTIRTKQCFVFIAGAGSAAVITKACVRIDEAFIKADAEDADLNAEHREILESSLEAIYERYVKTEYDDIGLIIVVSFQTPRLAPQLYETKRAMLVPATTYAAQGSGKMISDYLAGQLYRHGIGRAQLLMTAAFIFREAGKTSHGVGFGADMILIHEGNRSFEYYGAYAVKELEDGIPRLSDSLHAHWKEHVKLPDWYRDRVDMPQTPDTPSKPF